MSIKIGNLDINSFKVGNSDCKIYLGDTLLYPTTPSSYDVCYAVTDNISQYQERDFENVYDKTADKWYKLNNLNQYEEYGVYGSGRDITYYKGKLTIDEGYEYEWDGNSWINLGETSGSSKTSDFKIGDIDTPITSDASLITDGMYGIILPVSLSADTSSAVALIGSSDSDTLSNLSAHTKTSVIAENDIIDYAVWKFHSSETANTFYVENIATNKYFGYSNVSYSNSLPLVNESSKVPTVFSAFTINNVTAFAIMKGNSPSQYYAINDLYAYHYRYNWFNTLSQTSDLNNSFVIYKLKGADGSEYPKYYSEKSDPLNNLQFNTLEEAENYAYHNCVYDGMIAYIDGVRHMFSSEDGWVETILPGYLTFVAKTDGTFKFSGNSVSYSVDNGSTWTELASNTNSPTVTAGNKIMWKATGLTPSSSSGIGRFSSTGQFDVEGNAMSLLYGDDFEGQTDLTGKDNAFNNLFRNCTTVISAENLSLPATTLAYNCYYSMFSWCTSLTTAPALPSTTLAEACYANMFQSCSSLTTAPALPATAMTEGCYYYMFQGCSSLTTAPALPATTLARGCYYYMFGGCTSLTTAPALPATTLATYCYSNMFDGCTSLITAPALPATTLADRCYNQMFNGCTSLTTAPALPATTLATQCYYFMFQGCTSLTTAPALPATTLANYCYSNMFRNCTSLTTAPELPATTLAQSCYQNMFQGCTSLTTAPELHATTLASNCYSYMFQGCTSLNSITCNATNISASNCTYAWVYGVSSSGTFYKNASMSSWSTGTSGIPNGWTVEDIS